MVSLAPIVKIKWRMREVPDSAARPIDLDCYTPEQAKAWRNGDWCFVGIKAEAEITVQRGDIITSYCLTSAGCWGVESFSSRDFKSAIFAEEKVQLAADLKAIADYDFLAAMI